MKWIFKQSIVFIIFLNAVLLQTTDLLAFAIPTPPPLEPIEELVNRPDGPGNGAEFYLQAEELYRKSELMKSPEERKPLELNSDIMALMEKGLNCQNCIFPYSLELETPMYNQQIPMMALYIAAAHTWRQAGDQAVEENEPMTAINWYSKSINLGLQLFEEPGITIIQDMIALACIQEGIEGMGDLFIILGKPDKAAICAEYLDLRARYVSGLQELVRSILRDPNNSLPQLTESFKAVAREYKNVSYTPVKIEIILSTAELYAIHRKDPEVVKFCRMVLEPALKDPDPRVQKAAYWAANWSLGEYVSYLRTMGHAINLDLIMLLISLL